MRINRFLAQTCLVMSLGLLIAGCIPSRTADNLYLVRRITLDPWIAFGLFMVQILIVVSLGAVAMRLSPILSSLLFVFYSALTGLTLTSIFLFKPGNKSRSSSG